MVALVFALMPCVLYRPSPPRRLRHQLVVFKRKRPRPRLCSDAAFGRRLRRLWPGSVNALIMIMMKPDAVVSWPPCWLSAMLTTTIPSSTPGRRSSRNLDPLQFRPALFASAHQACCVAVLRARSTSRARLRTSNSLPFGIASAKRVTSVSSSAVNSGSGITRRFAACSSSAVAFVFAIGCMVICCFFLLQESCQTYADPSKFGRMTLARQRPKLSDAANDSVHTDQSCASEGPPHALFLWWRQ